MSHRIHRAQKQDATELAALAGSTFRAAFAAQNTASDMDAYVERAFSVEQTEEELADSANTFFLGRVLGGDVGGASSLLGYAKWRRGETDPSVSGSSPIELQRLYVDHSAIGTGLGAALMDHGLDWAASQGHDFLWLGVWEENPRALDFYRRWGFEVVGAHFFRLGSDDQKDLIMQRPIRLENSVS